MSKDGSGGPAMTPRGGTGNANSHGGGTDRSAVREAAAAAANAAKAALGGGGGAGGKRKLPSAPVSNPPSSKQVKK
jgi:hypothetical protein